MNFTVYKCFQVDKVMYDIASIYNMLGRDDKCSKDSVRKREGKRSLEDKEEVGGKMFTLSAFVL